MHGVNSCLLLMAVLVLVLAGCGGGTASSPMPSGANAAQVSLTIHDNPPAGVTVLSFEMEITGAALQPSDSSAQPVSMISEPDDVELEHLQTESALLGSKSVPAGTYSGLMVSFASPKMTIQNQTGGTLTLGGQSCLDQQICQFSPKLNQSSVTLHAPNQPFPLTLSANSPVVLKMDFNIDSSIQQSDLSITPTISLTQLSANSGNENDEEMEIVGSITSIGQSGPSFTMQAGMNGPSYSITTDSNTHFDFGAACSAENFSCLQTGQTVKVDAKMQSDGSLLAFDVKFFEPPNQMSLSGTVTSVTGGSFQIVLFDEGWFGSDEMGNFSIGAPLTVNLAAQTTFSIDTSGFMLPSGLNFGSAADLMVGQKLQLHPTGAPTGTAPNLTITVDQVQLEPSHVTATITAINTGGNPQTFTLGSLPMFFINAGVTSLQVDVLSTTQFETAEDQMMSGLSSFKTGEVVSVRGLLFNTMTTPTMVAEKVVSRSSSSED